MYTYKTAICIGVSLAILLIRLVLLQLIKIVEKKQKQYNHNIFNFFYINIEIPDFFSNSELNIKNIENIFCTIFENNKPIKKEKMTFDVFCQKFYFHKKLKLVFFTFLQQEQKYFFHAFNEQKKRKSFFIEKVYNHENKSILLKFYSFKNKSINIYDKVDEQKIKNIFSKIKIFAKIDFYANENLKDYFNLFKENVYEVVNNKKIYFMSPNKKENENSFSIFIFDLENSNIQKTKILLKKIAELFQKFLNHINYLEDFDVYSCLIKKNKKDINENNWKNKINSLIKYSFNQKIAILDQTLADNIEKNNKEIEKCTFDFTDIYDVEREKNLGYLVKICNNIWNYDLLKFNFLTIKSTIQRLMQEFNCDSKNITTTNNANKNTNLFLKVDILSIYNNENIITKLQSICETFKITIFLCFEMNKLFKSQITKKTILADQIEKMKKQNNKIKFCLYLKEDQLFIDDDTSEIFDCFIIYLLNFSYFKVIFEKLLKYHKIIILENINGIEKIKKLIRKGIGYIANNKLKTKVNYIKKIKEEIRNAL
ncbi:MAG: hypothetical protein J6Y70_01210 [Bacilli bacterium]|nr:hypothetical protein [Bacilli bacterium]